MGCVKAVVRMKDRWRDNRSLSNLSAGEVGRRAEETAHASKHWRKASSDKTRSMCAAAWRRTPAPAQLGACRRERRTADEHALDVQADVAALAHGAILHCMECVQRMRR